jgi:hypothetical protein
MKSLLALTMLVVLWISPASARCGLLTWAGDDTCKGPFQPKSAQEIVSQNWQWCRTHAPNVPLQQCAQALADQQIARMKHDAQVRSAIINSIPDNPYPAPRSVMCTSGLGTMYCTGW